MRDNKKGLSCRRRVLQQNPRHQIQPYWQKAKIPESSKKEAFYSGTQ